MPSPRQIRNRRFALAWVLVAAIFFMTAGVLLMMGLAAANGDTGSTWSNSHANDLIAPIVACAGLGVAALVYAWVLARRR
jgi:hypothetical protein